MPYDPNEIIETIHMTEVEHLDIRTVSLGVSLRDCVHQEPDKLLANIRDKLMRAAENHVKTPGGPPRQGGAVGSVKRRQVEREKKHASTALSMTHRMSIGIVGRTPCGFDTGKPVFRASRVHNLTLSGVEGRYSEQCVLQNRQDHKDPDLLNN